MSEIRRVKDIEWLINNYMTFFEEFGMNRKNIIEYYQTWKINKSERIEDYVWHIFNHLLNENAQQSENLKDLFERNQKIYSHMISFRRRFEGKKANEIQRLYNLNRVNLDLESNRNSNFEIDFVIIGTNDCDESKRISELIITKQQAVENNVIPYSKCTRKQGCVCLMGVMPKRDVNGRLIRKVKNE
tara:strand:+ start:857 stop:1417 length:561 start_codon:yes stop_codon:yes gene_type:complete